MLGCDHRLQWLVFVCEFRCSHCARTHTCRRTSIDPRRWPSTSAMRRQQQRRRQERREAAASTWCWARTVRATRPTVRSSRRRRSAVRRAPLKPLRWVCVECDDDEVVTNNIETGILLIFVIVTVQNRTGRHRRDARRAEDHHPVGRRSHRSWQSAGRSNSGVYTSHTFYRFSPY